MKKIILDLCGGTGSWSLPYKEAGYDVRNITWPKYDVRLYEPPKNVYGILSAPPCTMFSFARTNAKKSRNLHEGMALVLACLRIIWTCQYRIEKDTQKNPSLKFWALENPYFGMLRWFLGKPAFVFDPYEFGHYYQKKTAIWGMFNEPKKTPVEIPKEARTSTNRGKLTSIWKKMKEKAKTNSQDLPKFDYMKSKDIAPEWFGKLSRQDRRAITPRGFAKAFFKANK